MPARHWTVCALPCFTTAALLVAVGATRAQRPAPDRAPASNASISRLVGLVRDSLGHPIAYATVFAYGRTSATADEHGQFDIGTLPAGTTVFGVRRVGFAPVDFTIDLPPDSTVSVSIHLHGVAQRLRQVTVAETRPSAALVRSGFFERVRAGTGFFLQQAEIDARRPRQLEELLYGVPGVTVRVTNGRMLAFGAGQGGACRLSVFLDGRRYRLRGDEPLLVAASDVQAVEVYPRPTQVPMQFKDPDNPLCGSLVVWTKVD